LYQKVLEQEPVLRPTFNQGTNGSQYANNTNINNTSTSTANNNDINLMQSYPKDSNLSNSSKTEQFNHVFTSILDGKFKYILS
jgi:hypothetical protein